MNKQFAIVLGIGLALVAAGVGVVWVGSKGAHLELTGAILHTRVVALNPNASIVILDFRVKNPSDVLFVARAVTLLVDSGSGETLEGQTVSKADLENVFKYEKLLGPKFNDALTIGDKVPPHESLDRMAGARFELGESAVDARKSIRVRIEDINGTVAVIGEKPAAKK